MCAGPCRETNAIRSVEHDWTARPHLVETKAKRAPLEHNRAKQVMRNGALRTWGSPGKWDCEGFPNFTLINYRTVQNFCTDEVNSASKGK